MSNTTWSKLNSLQLGRYADYLGIAPMAVSIGMRNDLLPIGFSIHNKDGYSDSWSYHIIGERFIAYKHGKITNVQVENIEKNLETIITQFEVNISSLKVWSSQYKLDTKFSN
jgi:hypothetical protein